MSTTSIVMPVYNEIAFIRQTLQSIAGQADEVVISDNASTDGTSEVCQAFAAGHKNVIYKRQEKNLGGARNFEDAYAMSSGDYTVIMGGHDLLSRNYVSSLKALLDANPDAVLAYAPCVHFTRDYVFKYIFDYPFHALLASENPADRVWAAITQLVEASSYYGMYRRSVYKGVQNSLRGAYPYEIIDSNEMPEQARLGRWLFCPEATLYRVDPRRPQGSTAETAIRVLKATYNEDYDPAVHLPERIAISHAQTVSDTILKAIDGAEHPQLYKDQCMQSLMHVWAFSDEARRGMEEVFRDKGFFAPEPREESQPQKPTLHKRIINRIKKYCKR